MYKALESMIIAVASVLHIMCYWQRYGAFEKPQFRAENTIFTWIKFLLPGPIREYIILIQDIYNSITLKLSLNFQ